MKIPAKIFLDSNGNIIHYELLNNIELPSERSYTVWYSYDVQITNTETYHKGFVYYDYDPVS